MPWSKIIIYTIRVVFALNAGYLLFTGDLLKIALLLGSLLLTYLPELFTKISGVTITIGGKVAYILFIFGAQWLGTYLRLYDMLIWWDIMLHFTSGLLLSYIGLLILLWIDKDKTLIGQDKSVLIVIFMTLVSISGAAVWEIMEFSSDVLFGSNTQLGSLQDTMEDMVFGAIGALLFGVYCYVTMSKEDKSPIYLLIKINKAKQREV